jgi:lysophospholipase L1-like esterase
MRDRDRSLEKSPGEFRIALLGASVVEGVHVAPHQVVNIRMEGLLADKGYKNVEVLNFGVEGIGTTQEFLIYKQRVRRFRPDLVVLVFSSNDVMDNSSTLQPKAYGIHTWYAPYYDLGPDGNLIFRPVEPRSFNKVRSFLEAHSEVVYYFERMWSRVKLPLFNYTWQGLPINYGLYGDPLDAEWERAWLVTEKVMALLHETVSDDGGKFIVLMWPESSRIDPDWQRRFTKEVGKLPPDLKPFSVEERLKGIADRNRIALEFLYPYMQAYRDAHHLQWPYFSFTCDPHYSALGHQVFAEAIVQRLEEHHLLPERDDSPKQRPAAK